VSHERLKCMFPVANVPLLHYVIEFLMMNRVTEIFIAACVNRGQIDAFLKAQSYKGVKIHVVSLESCSNFGDALREINQLQTINHEFVLVRGDLITNADIQGALKEHFRVKAEEKEKKLILTKLFTKIPFSNNIRSLQQEVVLMLDK
jgi:translation initiation factor eIF-2B subunit epsilon